MLPNNLRQASGKTGANIERQARQGLPRILHIPFQYPGYRSLIGDSLGFAVLIEEAEQSISISISSIVRAAGEIEVAIAIGGAAMELPVDNTLGLNAGLELVGAPQFRDTLGK